MTLVRRPFVNEDPFTLARSLFGWEPLATTRAPERAVWNPAFEVKETPEAFIVKADLPGIVEKDLDVSLHNDVLTVSATRQAEAKKEGEAFKIYEREFGSFARNFQLPDTADADKITAALTHGVLTLTIGKKAASQPRKIALTNKQ